MNVLLLKKIKKLGEVGSEVSVKPGYARNYLFPHNIALPLTPENIEIVEKKKQELLKIEEELKANAIAQKEKYTDYTILIDVNIKEDNIIYGSITLQNVIDKLKSDGFDLEKKQVNLPRGPIKTIADDHIVTINLHSDVQVTVPIILNVIESEDTSNSPIQDPTDSTDSTNTVS